jgi:late competence protein required for DNA uptake (superfamily II DNA/RNA helicase)
VLDLVLQMEMYVLALDQTKKVQLANLIVMMLDVVAMHQDQLHFIGIAMVMDIQKHGAEKTVEMLRDKRLAFLLIDSI